MLELTGITKQFVKTAFTLNKVSFSLPNGMHLLAGPNGAGKSTLLRIAATVLQPDAGNISFHGRDIYSNVRDFRLSLGYLPQSLGFYAHMTGIDFLKYIADLKGISPRIKQERIDYVIDLLSIKGYSSRRISTWSTGMRQRLGLAQALLNDPAILLLDEPFCGLDTEEAYEAGQLLDRLSPNKIILISSHIIEGLAISRLLLLINGRLSFSGLPAVFLDEAQGQVWSVEATKDEWLRLQQNYPVSAAIFTGNSYQCKIISDSEPAHVNAKSVSPTMEDAYIYWLKCCSQPAEEGDVC